MYPTIWTEFKKTKHSFKNEMKKHNNDIMDLSWMREETLRWQLCMHYHATPPPHLNLPKSCQHHGAAGEAIEQLKENSV